MDARVSGILNIENINNHNQAMHPRQPFFLRHMIYAQLLSLFKIMHQSNEDLTVYDVEWNYLIDRNSYLVGLGNAVVPKWLSNFTSNFSIKSVPGYLARPRH